MMEMRARRTRITVHVGMVLALAPHVQAFAQSSSLYRARATKQSQPGAYAAGAAESADGVWAIGRKINPVPASTRVIERYSLTAVAQDRPRPIQVHDFVTIIVREQKAYESEAETGSEKEWKVDSELSKWFRLYPDDNLGLDRLSNGNPSIAYKWKNDYETEADAGRTDKFTTRIQAEIVDVKPNGNLVIQAKKHERHDEEELTVTLSGMCRAADITADNTVLSTQVYDLQIVSTHTGGVRDGTRRGWIPRSLDFLRPF